MNGRLAYLFEIQSTAFSVLSMLAYVGGFCGCLAHWRLSRWLWLVAAGFVGLFVSSAIAQLAVYQPTTSNRSMDLIYLGFITSIVLETLSNLSLVAGLGLALIQIRKQVALSMEPDHGRS